jgi:hypothetical protein
VSSTTPSASTAGYIETSVNCFNEFRHRRKLRSSESYHGRGNNMVLDTTSRGPSNIAVRSELVFRSMRNVEHSPTSLTYSGDMIVFVGSPVTDRNYTVSFSHSPPSCRAFLTLLKYSRTGLLIPCSPQILSIARLAVAIMSSTSCFSSSGT